MDPVTIMDTARFEKLEQSIIELTKIIKQLKIKDPLMTSKDVQEYLNKGSTWVDANKHKIGCSRIGGEWSFRKSDVDAYWHSHFHRDS